MRSQLMVAAKIIVGASATIAASQGRERTIRDVAATASSRNGNNITTFIAKKASGALRSVTTAAIPRVIHAATSMNMPINTGYSKG